MPPPKNSRRPKKPDDDAATHQPHDKLVQSVFEDIPTVVAFLQAYLPKNVTRQLDLDATRVKRQPTRFLSGKLKSTQADLLFLVPLKDAPADGTDADASLRVAYIYVLLEHQSTENKHMGLRLLDYKTSIWKAHAAKTPDTPLPLVLALVLAQCQGEWRVPTTFGPAQFGMDATASGDFGRYVPAYTYEVLDLAKLSYRQILGTARGRLLLRVLKAWREGALLSKQVMDKDLIDAVDREAPDLITRFFNYILSNRNVDTDSFEATVQGLNSENLTSKAMSAAEQYTQRGIEKGIGIGREEGQIIGLIRAFQAVSTPNPIPKSVLLQKPLAELKAILAQLQPPNFAV